MRNRCSSFPYLLRSLLSLDSSLLSTSFHGRKGTGRWSYANNAETLRQVSSFRTCEETGACYCLMDAKRKQNMPVGELLPSGLTRSQGGNGGKAESEHNAQPPSPHKFLPMAPQAWASRSGDQGDEREAGRERGGAEGSALVLPPRRSRGRRGRLLFFLKGFISLSA